MKTYTLRVSLCVYCVYVWSDTFPIQFAFIVQCTRIKPSSFFSLSYRFFSFTQHNKRLKKGDRRERKKTECEIEKRLFRQRTKLQAHDNQMFWPKVTTFHSMLALAQNVSCCVYHKISQYCTVRHYHEHCTMCMNIKYTRINRIVSVTVCRKFYLEITFTMAHIEIYIFACIQ